MSYVAPGYWASGYAVEDESGIVVPANSNAGSVVGPSSAAQTHRATPGSSDAGATVSSTFASQGFFAFPQDCQSGSTVSASNAPQNNQVQPANSNSGATVGASYALMLSLDLTFPVASYPHTLQSAEYPAK